MMGLALHAIEAARKEVQAKLDSGAPGAEGWKAALWALDSVQKHEADLMDTGEDAFAHLLTHIGIGGDTDEIVRAIKTMDAADLIDQVKAGTQELKADTAERQARRARLLEMAQEIGIIGARLVLSMIL